MSSTRKITLKSSDGKAFEVDEAVALESQTIKHMIDDDCADSVIPLPNVTSKILAKVFEYCKKHVEAAVYDDKFKEWDICDFECMCCYLGSFRPSGIKAWDAEFVKVDRATLSKLVLAANFLNIESLLDLTCQTVRDTVKGKTREEIGRFFNIKNDFIPEEEEEDSRDNYWVIER